MEPPRVIFLNGASSSGKTGIATILQTDLPGIWMHLSSDALFDMLPKRIQLEDEKIANLAYLKIAIGMYGCIASFAKAGTNVLADGVFNRRLLEETREALEGVPSLIVGVMCPLEELERRESRRHDRDAGLARGQFPGVNLPDLYDLTVDTSDMSPAECANVIIGATGLADQ